MINKTAFFVFIILLIILILEIVFLFYSNKRKTITSIEKTYASYVLSSSLTDAANNNLSLIAKTELQYQGKINKLDLKDDNENLQIQLMNMPTQDDARVTFKVGIKSSSVEDENGKKIGIDELKINDIIKVTFLYDYKKPTIGVLIKKLERDYEKK